MDRCGSRRDRRLLPLVGFGSQRRSSTGRRSGGRGSSRTSRRARSSGSASARAGGSPAISPTPKRSARTATGSSTSTAAISSGPLPAPPPRSSRSPGGTARTRAISSGWGRRTTRWRTCSPSRTPNHEGWFRPMLRLVDVPGAFEARGYPRSLQAAVELRVDDPAARRERRRMARRGLGGRRQGDHRLVARARRSTSRRSPRSGRACCPRPTPGGWDGSTRPTTTSRCSRRCSPGRFPG